MSTADDRTTEDPALPSPTAPPPPGSEAGGTPGVSNILRRWKREDFIKRGSLTLRGFGLIFSLLAFIIMASNKHGDWMNFDKYEEYRYVLGIAILSTLYTGLQTLRHFHQLLTGKELVSPQNTTMLDFIGDQVIAYLLMSAASSAVPLTDRMRENNDNIFTDSSASAISMEFLAFVFLAASALISGFKLSTQTYI